MSGSIRMEGARHRKSPARTPDAPAFLSPFFFTMKLAPMKKLEESASTSPLMLSADIPSTQLPPAAEVDASVAISAGRPHQAPETLPSCGAARSR